MRIWRQFEAGCATLCQGLFPVANNAAVLIKSPKESLTHLRILQSHFPTQWHLTNLVDAKQRLASQTQRFGREDPLLISLHLEVAKAFVARQEYQEANDHLLTAQAISENSDCFRFTGITVAKSSIAEARGMLYQAQGHLTEAVPLYQQALMIRRDALGTGKEEHHSLWYSYKLLAWAHLAASQFDQAKQIYYRQSLIEPPFVSIITRVPIWREGKVCCAVVDIMRGDINTAIIELETELTTMESQRITGLPVGIARINLAICHLHLGDNLAYHRELSALDTLTGIPLIKLTLDQLLPPIGEFWKREGQVFDYQVLKLKT